MYLVAGVIATLVFLFVPGMRIGGLLNLIALSSPIVILVALRLNHVEYKLPWLLIALGQVFFVTGDVITYNYERFFGTELPYPSIGDVFYLSVYPCLFLGILLLIRHRSPGRDRDSAIDSLIVGIGVGVLSWVFLIAPYTHDASLTTAAEARVDRLPVDGPDARHRRDPARGRTAGGRTRRSTSCSRPSSRCSSRTRCTAGPGSTAATTTRPAIWKAAGRRSTCCSAPRRCTLPSARSPSARSRCEARLSRTRLAVLAVVSLTAPLTDAIIVSRYSTGTQRTDQMVVIVASIILFLLVIARMSGLVRQQEKSAGRERALREAGVALVTATNRAAIHDAAIEAAHGRSAGEGAAIRLCEEFDGGTDEFVVVAADGDTGDAIGAPLLAGHPAGMETPAAAGSRRVRRADPREHDPRAALAPRAPRRAPCSSPRCSCATSSAG